MKYELTREQLEEMVLCIVQCHLNEDDAMEYALSVCSAFTCDDAEVVWLTDDRIDAIGQNGNDGLHYNEAIKAGVYES